MSATDKKMVMFLMGFKYKRSPESIIKGVCMWDGIYSGLGIFYGFYVSTHSGIAGFLYLLLSGL